MILAATEERCPCKGVCELLQRRNPHRTILDCGKKAADVSIRQFTETHFSGSPRDLFVVVLIGRLSGY
jgi:hypothetical protein